MLSTFITTLSVAILPCLLSISLSITLLTVVETKHQMLFSHSTHLSHRLRRLLLPWKGWHSFAPVGVVWSICQVEAPLYPSFSLVAVCWRFLQVCMLWLVLGGCVHALKRCLRRGHRQVSAAALIQSLFILFGKCNHVTFIQRLCFN